MSFSLFRKSAIAQLMEGLLNKVLLSSPKEYGNVALKKHLLFFLANHHGNFGAVEFDT